MADIFGGGGSAAKSNRFYSLQVQTSSAGVPKPILWGTRRLAPNLVWYGNFQSREASSGGGKSGDSGGNYTYSCAVIMALCEGPTATIGRVWADKEDTNLAKLNLTYMQGQDGQLPVTAIFTSAPDEARAYPFTAYVGTATYALGSSPNLPNHNFETQSWLHNAPNTMDAQFPDVLADFATNKRYGCQLEAAYVGDLSSWRTYCQALGFYGSPLLSSQETGIDVINRWAQITNTAIFWSGSVIKALPLGDQVVTGNGVTWDPGQAVVPQYDFEAQDYLAEDGADPVKVTIKDTADTSNYGSMTYTNRADSYQDDVVSARIQAAIDADRLRPLDTITAREFCDAAPATLSLQLILQRACYITNTYAWKTGIRYRLLEPGDIVTLTDANLGLDQFPVRITKVTVNQDRTVDFEAEEFPAGVGTATAHPHPVNDNATINTAVDPGDVSQVVIMEPSPGLTGGVQQVWIGAAGGPWWGGASVHISLDDEKYERLGEINGPCRVGTLASALPTGTDPDTVNTPLVTLATSRVQLGTGDQADADAGRTLCVIGTELVSYATATVTAANTYRLGYLRRGQYGTTMAAHAAGAPFARLDDRFFTYDLPAAYVGQRLYIKLTSFNIFQSAEYDPSQVNAYTYTPVGAAGMLPAPTNLQLSVITAYQADGTVQPAIQASWTPVDGGSPADTSLRWAPAASNDWQTLTVPAGTTQALLTPVIQNVTYQVQAASRLSATVRSIWAPQPAATITVGGVLGGASVTHLELYGQGLDTEFLGRDIHLVWQGNFPATTYAIGAAPNGTGAGFRNPYFQDYLVTISDPATGTVLRVERVTVEEYIYTFDKNAQDLGGPHRTVRFDVAIEDKLGGVTKAATLTVTNPVPAQVQIQPLPVTSGQVLLGYIPGTERDFAGVNAWVDTKEDVDTSGVPAVTGSSPPLIVGGLTAGQQYWGKIQTFDSFGSAGCPISAAVTWTQPYISTPELADSIIGRDQLTPELVTEIDGTTNTAAETKTIVDQLSAQTYLKVQANGHVAGIGEYADETASRIVLLADILSLALPSDTDPDGYVTPFVIGTKDGQPVIVLNAVTYAGTIHADQVDGGTFGAGVVYAGSVFANQLRGGTITGETLTLKADGNAAFVAMYGDLDGGPSFIFNDGIHSWN
ncbi:phage tail protein, partial [Nitrospirillum amazonense]|uniref:phage tail protein n=1 Tax=Nitrospirillum amazonense TaxID=28077 RepID=UPI0024122AF8